MFTCTCAGASGAVLTFNQERAQYSKYHGMEGASMTTKSPSVVIRSLKSIKNPSLRGIKTATFRT